MLQKVNHGQSLMALTLGLGLGSREEENYQGILSQCARYLRSRCAKIFSTSQTSALNP